MDEDNKKLLQSFLRLHDSMIRSLDNYDSAELRRLLGIKKQGLIMALDEKVTK